MSNSNVNARLTETSSSVPRLDKNDLKSIKVSITRRNVSEPSTSTTLLRSLDDPAQLVVHYRPDEGARPIFDRSDIVVNKVNNQEERTVLSSLPVHSEQKTSSQPATSRSSSRSSRSSPGRSPTKFQKDPERKRSPQAHCSREEGPRDKDYYSSKHRMRSPTSCKAVWKMPKSPTPPPKTKPHRYPRRSPTPPPKDKPRPRERDRSPPPHYRGSDKAKPRSRSPQRGAADRRRSRTPPPGHRSERGRYSRSPHRYRGPPERKRSRSPPPSRGRSRSRSPYHRSRYSRSPHRYEDYRRHERSKRSRSPRRHRYSPEHHSRRSPHEERGYQGPRIPNPYFEGAEFWIPDPTLQPRFIPRQMIPPGAFPYGPPFRPGMPMMIPPPRVQFRPRIVYNRPPRPRPTAPTTTQETVTTSTTAPTVVTSSVKDEAQSSAQKEQVQEPAEHSSPNKSDNENNKS